MEFWVWTVWIISLIISTCSLKVLRKIHAGFSHISDILKLMRHSSVRICQWVTPSQKQLNFRLKFPCSGQRTSRTMTIWFLYHLWYTVNKIMVEPISWSKGQVCFKTKSCTEGRTASGYHWCQGTGYRLNWKWLPQLRLCRFTGGIFPYFV